MSPDTRSPIPDPLGVAFDRREYDRRATPVKLEPLPAPMPWRRWVMAGVVWGAVVGAVAWVQWHG